MEEFAIPELLGRAPVEIVRALHAADRPLSESVVLPFVLKFVIGLELDEHLRVPVQPRQRKVVQHLVLERLPSDQSWLSRLVYP